MSIPISVIRAKTLISLAGERPARGKALFTPLKKVDNGALVVRNGVIEKVLSWPVRSLPVGVRVKDVGAVCLAPACCNAHTHLNLSHLAGRTIRSRGFVNWLASLIPLLDEPIMPNIHKLAVQKSCANMADAGTVHIGDFCGITLVNSGPELVDDAGAANGIGISHFCEWFGFARDRFEAEENFWPAHCQAALSKEDIWSRAAPCAHALYSNAAQTLRRVRHFCVQHGKIFAFHLAESPEEEQMLVNGDGPLRDLYATRVLPVDWQPPCMRPFAYAADLGLLGPGTLAIHGVQLNVEETRQLAASGTALCLCPRSNRNLALGEAPVAALMENGVLLCLGTDGLTSNDDLDVRQEAVYLRESLDISPEALIRFLTVNGAAALGLKNVGQLIPGNSAKFCILPEALLR